MTDTTKVIVVGGHTPVGAETARLAVAIGYQITAITPTGSAPSDEPWVQGVSWIAPGGVVEGPDVVIVFDPDLLPIQPLFGSDHPRLVVVDAEFNHEKHVSLDTQGVATSRAAMACLRCAVEDDRHGHYTPKDVAHIGDAMMIQ